MISADDGSAIALPSDGGLEVSGPEGESEAKARDGKSCTTRVTIAMTRCAIFELHVVEEIFAEFGDEDDLENAEDESVEQEGPLGEGFGEAEVKHKIEEKAWVAETLLTGIPFTTDRNLWLSRKSIRSVSERSPVRIPAGLLVTSSVR